MLVIPFEVIEIVNVLIHSLSMSLRLLYRYCWSSCGLGTKYEELRACGSQSNFAVGLHSCHNLALGYTIRSKIRFGKALEVLQSYLYEFEHASLWGCLHVGVGTVCMLRYVVMRGVIWIVGLHAQI